MHREVDEKHVSQQVCVSSTFISRLPLRKYGSSEVLKGFFLLFKAQRSKSLITEFEATDPESEVTGSFLVLLRTTPMPPQASVKPCVSWSVSSVHNPLLPHKGPQLTVQRVSRLCAGSET